MGTSQSSGGPGGGVPMVPPWTPAAPPDTQSDSPAEFQEDAAASNDKPDARIAPPTGPEEAVAPASRFGSVRRSLGNFARSGSEADLRKGLGHYVRSGYGGSNTITRRFGGTAQTAASFGDVLYGYSSGQAQPPSVPDATELTGRSPEEIANSIIEAVRPIDGTQDAEAERAALHDAISELLTQFPEADLLNLDEAQREFAIERFTALDVVRRFELDVGKTLIERAPTRVVALGRMKMIRSYIKEAVAAAFRKMRDQGRRPTPGRIARVVQTALRETFEVFEGYAE